MTPYSYPTAFSSWYADNGQIDFSSEEYAAIARVVKSGKLTMGPEVEAFEREFAYFHGRKHGIMVNSGSSANLVAVAALFNLERGGLFYDDDDWRGRHVTVPALAWSTTYAPLVQHGLKLLLNDCDETWTAPLIDNPPKLAVIASILGNPCSAYKVRPQGSFIIEDNCEGFGAWAGKVRAGCLGDMSTFSFFWSHQISAIEGGMVLTDHDEMARACRMLRAHGWTRDVEKPERFEDEYDFQVFGYNVRPLEMHAAIAREQLKKAQRLQAARIGNLMHFVSRTRGLPIKMQVSNGVLNPFGMAFTCESSADRAALVSALRANSIDCRLPTGGSFHLHKYGKAYERHNTPNADIIHQTGLFLGNAPFDISDKIEKAAKVMRAVFDARARAA